MAQALPAVFVPRPGMVVLPGIGVAYKRVVAAERAADQECEKARLDRATTKTRQNSLDDNLVCLRVLGYASLEVDNLDGLGHVLRSIDSCADTSTLIALGLFYLKHFLKLCTMYCLSFFPSFL
jgi:hypothetical protein